MEQTSDSTLSPPDRSTTTGLVTDELSNYRFAELPKPVQPIVNRLTSTPPRQRRAARITSSSGWEKARLGSPHPESMRLRRALGLSGVDVRWSRVVYRSASIRYANKDDLLTGVGSKMAGARWNPPNSILTVYASLDPHTALDEVLAHYRYYNIPVESAMPRVVISVRVSLFKVLDLTDGKTRSIIRVSEYRMLHEPWREEQEAGREALTQTLGRVACELGWEGLLVGSAARNGGTNLVVFPANLTAHSSLKIINVGHLPRRE